MDEGYYLKTDLSPILLTVYEHITKVLGLLLISFEITIWVSQLKQLTISKMKYSNYRGTRIIWRKLKGHNFPKEIKDIKKALASNASAARNIPEHNHTQIIIKAVRATTDNSSEYSWNTWNVLSQRYLQSEKLIESGPKITTTMQKSFRNTFKAGFYPFQE